MKTLLTAAVLALTGSASIAQPSLPESASAEPQTLRFYGYGRDLKTGRYLYTEVHQQRVEGERWLGGSICYYDAANHLIGKKTLELGNDQYVPVYRLEQPDFGYVEGITENRDTIEMIRQAATGKPQESKRTAKKSPMAADSGFHMLIRANFESLIRGDTIPFSMAVAGNLGVYKFRIKRVEDSTFEGRPAVNMRVEPDSLLRLMIDPLELTYDPEGAKLLEYRGISNIHDPVSRKAYDVRITYAAQPPADAPDPLPPFSAPDS
jgi:hypothetical protein